MEVIYKYELDRRGSSVPMPQGAKILSTGMQYGNVCIWAIVDPEAPTYDRRYEVVGTGFERPMEPFIYVGTALQEEHGTVFVWHVFVWPSVIE